MDFVADNVTSTDGAGSIDTVSKLTDAIDRGDAWDIAAEGASVGLETLGAITDPFESLVTAGISWAIEHCEPLRKPLDELAGDPRAVDEGSRAWLTRSEQLKDTAQDIRQQAQNETAEWHGEAGDAYRKAATALAEHVESMSQGATGVASGIRNAGVLVATIRGLIRGLIADFIAEVIRKLAVSAGLSFVTAGVSLGAAISWLLGKVGIMVGKVAQKLSDLVSKLSDMLGNMGRLSSALSEVSNRASRLAATGAVHVDNVASSIGSSQSMRNTFNGASAGRVDNSMEQAANFTSPSGFNYTHSTGSIDLTTNHTGDAIKFTNETNKNSSQVDEKWQDDQKSAEHRAAKQESNNE